MRLFNSIGPNPHAVRMAAAEKGVDLALVPVDIMGAENRGADYVGRVPTGGIPALELADGTIIAEITAIIEYLEERHPTPALVGTTAEERAEARMWTRRIDHLIVEPMANGFRATEGRAMFAPRLTLVSEASGAELKAIAAERILWLDGLMQGRSFVCGPRFTMADILLYCFVLFGSRVGQPIPAGASWLPGWFDRIAARPSARA